MNVELLNTICAEVTNELESTQIVNQLQQLVGQMQNMVNQPQTPQHQQNVSSLRKTVVSALRNAKTNHFSPLWKENLKEIGYGGLLGNELADTIEGIFNENKITVSVAHNKIASLVNQLSSLFTHTKQLTQNLTALKIGKEKLTVNESEFSVLIPRTAIKSDAEKFADEILESKKIIDVFNELITGSCPDVKLRTIASSDFSFFFEIMPKVALGLLTALNLIVITYQSILEIRKQLKELKEQGVPDESLKGVEDYANKKMADSISAGVQSLINQFAMEKLDSGRKNELSISLKFSMNTLSNRIDSGYNFNVRFSEETSDSGDDEENVKKRQEEIQSMSKNLEFMNLTGEKILSLPEKQNENGENV